MTENQFQTRYILILVMLASTLGQVATDIYLSSLPDLTLIFNTSSELLKLTITVVYFGYALMQFITGPLSDLYGRKFFMLLGLGIFILGAILAQNSQTIESLILARLIQGMGIGSFGVANRAILFDTFTGNQYIRAIAIVGIAMTVSSLVAPMLGATIHQSFGWRANFSLSLLYAGLLFFAVLVFLPETINFKISKNLESKNILSFILSNYQVIIISKQYWKYGLINMLGFSVFIFYLSSAPFIFQEELNYNNIQYARAICWLAVGYIAGSAIGGRVVKSYGPKVTISIGNYCQLLAGLIMFIFYINNTTSIVTILGPMVFFVFGNGFITPSATSLLINNFPNRAASAAAAMGTLMTMGTAVLNAILFHFGSHTLIFIVIIISSSALAVRIIFYGDPNPTDGVYIEGTGNTGGTSSI
ncbi:MAG: multidrug effflux MFS transporter [Gammaproteobacteria bacterium]|nr:multidrug effflux MFS transporter [Gammaproteobacteria bacterium]